VRHIRDSPLVPDTQEVEIYMWDGMRIAFRPEVASLRSRRGSSSRGCLDMATLDSSDLR